MSRQIPHVPAGEQTFSDEQRLWIAVIYNAACEAIGGYRSGSKSERETTRREATKWFQQGGRDFEDVCIMAGIDPVHVCAWALDLISGKAKKPRIPNERGERGRTASRQGFNGKGQLNGERHKAGRHGGAARRENGRADNLAALGSHAGQS